MISNFPLYISKFAIGTQHVYTAETVYQKVNGDLQLQLPTLKQNWQNNNISKSKVFPKFQNTGIFFVIKSACYWFYVPGDLCNLVLIFHLTFVRCLLFSKYNFHCLVFAKTFGLECCMYIGHISMRHVRMNICIRAVRQWRLNANFVSFS